MAIFRPSKKEKVYEYLNQSTVALLAEFESILATRKYTNNAAAIAAGLKPGQLFVATGAGNQVQMVV